jgi:hypothetical protein
MGKILDIMTTLPLFNGLPEDQMAVIGKIAVEKNSPGGKAFFSKEMKATVFLSLQTAGARFTRYPSTAQNKFCTFSVPISHLVKFRFFPGKNSRPAPRPSPKSGVNAGHLSVSCRPPKGAPGKKYLKLFYPASLDPTALP